jgi:uncharacterized protein (DUF433 family)
MFLFFDIKTCEVQTLSFLLVVAIYFKLFGMKSNMENNLLQRITHNPDICHGKPCIRGLRYPVEFILELLSSGMTTEEILADYDDLESDDIFAVLLFAARLSQVKSIHKLAS